VRYAAYVALLVALWLLAWGDASLVNVISGTAVAVVLLVAFPPRQRSGVRLRPLGILRLVIYLSGQLIVSNVLIAREIVSRRSRVRTGVLAYSVPDGSDELLALIANVIALTPGTMTVEATHDPGVLYVHFLLLNDVGEARRAIARLEHLCRDALSEPPGTPKTLSRT
jgi:multisubunit Na+/H+ antiporter MnhE subunit